MSLYHRKIKGGSTYDKDKNMDQDGLNCFSDWMVTLRCGGDPNGSPPLSFGYNFRIRQSLFAQIRVILPCAECRGKSVRD